MSALNPNLPTRTDLEVLTRVGALLTTKEAARLVGLSHRTLQGMRRKGAGPGYVRLPTGSVRYDEAVLLGWAIGAVR